MVRVASLWTCDLSSLLMNKSKEKKSEDGKPRGKVDTRSRPLVTCRSPILCSFVISSPSPSPSPILVRRNKWKSDRLLAFFFFHFVRQNKKPASFVSLSRGFGVVGFGRPPTVLRYFPRISCSLWYVWGSRWCVWRRCGPVTFLPSS